MDLEDFHNKIQMRTPIFSRCGELLGQLLNCLLMGSKLI